MLAPGKEMAFIIIMFQYILKLSQCASCMLAVLQHQWMKQTCTYILQLCTLTCCI